MCLQSSGSFILQEQHQQKRHIFVLKFWRGQGNRTVDFDFKVASFNERACKKELQGE